jgi:hypothetical protein
MRRFNATTVPQIAHGNGSFPKGHKPWNAGTKGLTGANSGSFTKGSVPKNHVPIDTIKLRVNKHGSIKTEWIKIAEPNIWRELRRFNYEKFIGPIPAGMLVTSIDGNSLNADPGNLKLITRAENALRNHNRLKASESMKKVWARRRALNTSLQNTNQK